MIDDMNITVRFHLPRQGCAVMQGQPHRMAARHQPFRQLDVIGLQKRAVRQNRAGKVKDESGHVNETSSATLNTSSIIAAVPCVNSNGQW